MKTINNGEFNETTVALDEMSLELAVGGQTFLPPPPQLTVDPAIQQQISSLGIQPLDFGLIQLGTDYVPISSLGIDSSFTLPSFN